MKYLKVLVGLLLISCNEKQVDVTISVIPKPVSIIQTEGGRPFRGLTTSLDTTMDKEEYTLTVKNGKVTIVGGSDAGIFYAEQTLAQIKQQCAEGDIPNLCIQDKPKFAYRGAHFDCCRTFFSTDEVKEFLDMMAMHKLNIFHWHLTEDQGWRFESKKYPKLTEIGAWRNGTLVGVHGDTKINAVHGGYYTQQQMKDIVKYASDRFITIIPEIEMPGHSVAALASYPELGCTGGPYEVEQKLLIVTHDVFCVGKDSTIDFLKDILDEVCEIFPGEYIHIGGDESPKTRWKECPHCQARMKAENLEKESQLQSWLNKQIETYLKTKNKKIIGWDEILEGGVTNTATIMSWRGKEGGQAAAKQGNNAIMCPHQYCYFDYCQTSDPKNNNEVRWLGGPTNLRRVYSYNPLEGIDSLDQHHIIGLQSNMWTEFTFTIDDVMYQELPRIAAIAEIGWNADGRTDYDNFVARVKTAIVPLYEKKGWNYAKYAFQTPAVE